MPLIGDDQLVGSAPTTGSCGCSSEVERDVANVETRVRSPPSAPSFDACEAYVVRRLTSNQENRVRFSARALLVSVWACGDRHR